MFASLAFFEFFLVFFTYLERIEFFTVPATPCPVDSAAFYPVKQAAPRRARHLLAKIHVSFPKENSWAKIAWMQFLTQATSNRG